MPSQRFCGSIVQGETIQPKRTWRNAMLLTQSTSIQTSSSHRGNPTMQWSSKAGNLEEVRLLHDAKKLLLVHLAVPITVGFVNHLLQFLVCHALTKLLSYAL